MKAAYRWARTELATGEFGRWSKPWTFAICCIYAVTARRHFREHDRD